MKKIGFIGLGIMGKPMCLNLLKAGHEMVVYNRSEDPVEEVVAQGATAGSSPADVASKADVIITMLPNSPHVKEVVLGENGVIEGARAGALIIDMSSISPMVSQEVAKALAAKNIRMLDAPVSGGEPKAIDGTLAIMVGGDPIDFEESVDLFNCVGASAVLCGQIGAGNVTKLANQVIVAGNIAAMSEAMVLATKAKVDPEKVFNAIKGGLAGSTVLNAKVPLALKRDFNPGFRINLHIKDLHNVLETGHDIGVPLPITASIMEMMLALKVDGHGNDDHGGLIQYYEKMAKTVVANQ